MKKLNHVLYRIDQSLGRTIGPQRVRNLALSVYFGFLYSETCTLAIKTFVELEGAFDGNILCIEITHRRLVELRERMQT